MAGYVRWVWGERGEEGNCNRVDGWGYKNWRWCGVRKVELGRKGGEFFGSESIVREK